MNFHGKKLAIDDFRRTDDVFDISVKTLSSVNLNIFSDTSTPEERLRNIFMFTRDSIRYVFRLTRDPETMRASAVLGRRRGFCTQKAVLFSSLARAAGIPAGICFFDILDHMLMPSSPIRFHGTPCVYVRGRWIVYDITLDQHFCRSHNRPVVQFDPGRDCLMAPCTADGSRHVQYISCRGICSRIKPGAYAVLMSRIYRKDLFM